MRLLFHLHPHCWLPILLPAGLVCSWHVHPHHIAHVSSSPHSTAPGAYEPEKAKKLIDHSPAFAFGMRINHDKPNNTPGPSAYQVEKVNLDHQPAYSFGMRTKVAKPNVTPAPGAYCPEKANLDSTPKYSFGIRPTIDKPDNVPAPGAYSPEKAKVDSSPAYSFGVRAKQEKPSSSSRLPVGCLPPWGSLSRCVMSDRIKIKPCVSICAHPGGEQREGRVLLSVKLQTEPRSGAFW